MRRYVSCAPIFRDKYSRELMYLPQNRVTDHRLGISIMNIESVMEGQALQDILDSLVRKHQADMLEQALQDV